MDENMMKKHHIGLDISFLIPVYNVEQCLPDTIRAIAEQNYENINYEILCIDDGSTDDSYNVLISLSKKYPAMRVLKNDKNSGISFTRNRLIREAYGKYIWFVDSDDLLFKNSVDRVYSEIERVQGDVIQCNYLRISDDICTNEDYIFDRSIDARLVTDKEDLPVDQNGTKMNIQVVGLFLRSFLIDNGITYNEEVAMQEDTIFYWQFKTSTNKIYRIDTPVYLYRQRADSITHEANGNRMKDQYHSMLIKLQLYEKWLSEGFYDDRAVLENKIVLTKQGIVMALASLPDKSFIKEQLQILREKGIYPQPFCHSALHNEGNIIVNLLRFLLPIPLFFWIYHGVYKIFKK